MNFKTLDLSVEFYKHVRSLQIETHLRDQLWRATSSIPMNLAEGNAKFSYKDKARIYQIAYGSLRESQVILRLGDVKDEKTEELSNRLGAAIYKLIRGTQAKINADPF